ncbi:MAG: hypothetical protein JXA82_02120 [Sedimentisphaerales bacterium]|nr:hypothetical protein [Sedimentisphaerales bacterium]
MNHMNRRTFLALSGAASSVLRLTPSLFGQTIPISNAQAFLDNWANQPREFSQAPFWFWNDTLTEAELARQLDDFCAHGVYAFVIHPRAGLPKSIGWMSDRMIHFMRYTIQEAQKRDMWIILYDEGMYPSGSSSGQVVEANPAYRTRALFAVDLEESEPNTERYGIRIGTDGNPALSDGQTLVAITKRKKDGHRIAIVDRAARPGSSHIRGLHFTQEDPPRRSNHREVPENRPPGGDILNPESVQCFIKLVYQRFYDEFSDYFGTTIRAIFTDEPSILARGAERGAVPGTTGILEHVNEILGYDFTPYLPTLWYGDEPEAAHYRKEWARALQARLEKTFYEPISTWCAEHGVALTGHPAAPDDIGHLRHFQIPGQDIVWRYIEPGKPSALEGSQSTQAKCASSAMIHLSRRRNGNEFCGAYGHNFTFKEMKWLTYWLIARGCNLLIPHAFYYSIRGPRIDERPPDVGPNNVWWNQYKPYADTSRRLCWLNTDSKHICHLAILGRNDYLPWRAAKVCYQNQRDFNYLEARHLWEDARVDTSGITIAGMQYKALLLEDDPPAKAQQAIDTLEKAGRIIRYTPDMKDEALIVKIDHLIEPDVIIDPPSPDLRLRHVIKNGTHAYILFNEGENEVKTRLKTKTKGSCALLNLENGKYSPIPIDRELAFLPHELKVLFNPLDDI